MTKSALLVGINYIGTANELHGCIDDVKNMAQILKTKFGYTTIKLLTETDGNIRPTCQNIKTQMQALIANAKSGDSITFHYSGHGSLYSANPLEQSGQDSVLVPLDYATGGIISDEWLYQNVCLKVPAGVTLHWFCDSCHSGTILDLKYDVNSNCTPINNANPQTLAKYDPGQWTSKFSFTQDKTAGGQIQGHIICFSGCLDSQTSADAFINGQAQGAFTATLLEVLNENPNQTLGDILKEIDARLAIKGFTQRSELSISDLSVLNTTLAL